VLPLADAGLDVFGAVKGTLRVAVPSTASGGLVDAAD
jgi:hypothetical protein